MASVQTPDGRTSQQQSHPNSAMYDSTQSIDVEVGRTRPDDPAIRQGLRKHSDGMDAAATASRRRSQRMGTFRTVEDFDGLTLSPGWHPGAEPGLDPAKSDGGHASMLALTAPCDVTVVDFCTRDFAIQHLDNNNLTPFLDIPPPDWSTCRWINVNGLSWDVIKALGAHKKLHSLAIEDIMNPRSRTKVDWYPNHAFIVLTLQKLVHLPDEYDKREDEEEDDSKLPNTSESTRPQVVRTLQQYHSEPNDPRAKFMEKNSALASKDLAVVAEQVSIFIMDDNTIISFFEASAEDVARPIIRRLQTPDTILRQSCDASMIGQSIIDAIIDLALPVASCYSDVIADLELDVLTRPDITHTKRLYIIITEINKMVSFINPVTNLINALRDHKTDMAQDVATRELQNPLKGVIITPMTYIYLGDVLDHCILITESLGQIRTSADGMIDLIFNTISALQNESMKQLTVATIIFLPLTFLTGYFGQNFESFGDLKRGISFFWMIAAPVTVGVIALLLSPTLWGSARTLVQRYHIGRLRKLRRARAKIRRR